MPTRVTPAYPESLRLFYALWPDERTRAALGRVQSGIHGRSTPYENLHLTLAFLGRRPRALLPALHAVLTRLPMTDITLVLDRLGYFGRHRIAWAGMQAMPPALLALQRALLAELARQHIACDHRSTFQPHITLARDAPATPERALPPIEWRAQQIVLAQSNRHADSVRYRVLAARRLNEAAACQG